MDISLKHKVKFQAKAFSATFKTSTGFVDNNMTATGATQSHSPIKARTIISPLQGYLADTSVANHTQSTLPLYVHRQILVSFMPLVRFHLPREHSLST